MILLLKRVAKKSTYTIGKLFINGEYFCDTLEDKDRGLDVSMSAKEILEQKVHGKTAIPTGRYEITLDVVSPKFKDRPWAKPYSGKIPRLVGVPAYSGVLIHVGNDADDTLGCILVGHNDEEGMVTGSTITFMSLMEKYMLPAKRKKEKILIDIV